MTIDDRLTRAGQSFRDTHAEPARVHLAPPRDARSAHTNHHRRRRIVSIAVAVCAVVALTVGVVAWVGASGGSSPRPRATAATGPMTATAQLVALTSGVWRLATADADTHATLRPAYSYTLKVGSSPPDGRQVLSLDDDCNGTSAPIAIEADTIRIIGMGGTTLRACERPLDPAGAAVASLFDGPTITWSITGTDLRLQTATATLTFTLVPPAPLAADELDRTAWSLVSVVDAGSLVPTASERDTGLRFGYEPGGFTAGDGCNALSAGYTVDGRRLQFGKGGTTDMYCGDTVALRQAVDRVFGEGPTDVGRADDRLTLRRDDVVLVYDLVGEG